jgi:hypothetical protein
MIQIFPAAKIRIDPLARRERVVVCTTDEAGNLHIMGLEKYLRRGRSRIGQGRGGQILSASTSAKRHKES